MICSNGFNFEWEAGDGASPGFPNRDEVALTLHRPMDDMIMSGVPRNIDGGWSNGASFGNPGAPLTRVVVHWFNLPNWHGPLGLVAKTADREQEWSGRWVHQTSGWKITLDVRPDYQRVWRGLHKTYVYVMTHVMEVRRTDGSLFTADEVDSVLTALHVGISFALGRWAAPMLPVGEDSDGRVAWPIAPGFEAIAQAVIDALRELPTMGVSEEGIEDAAAVGEEVLNEVVQAEPDRGKIRRAVAALKGYLAPIATGAVTATVI